VKMALGAASGFGNLGVLASELRCLIWNYLDTQTELAAMCTHSEMHDEIHGYVHDSLEINLRPHSTNILETCASSNHNHSLRSIAFDGVPYWITKVPFEQVKCLKFEIMAPSLDVPANLSGRGCSLLVWSSSLFKTQRSCYL
jgi:hypothetical protein